MSNLVQTYRHTNGRKLDQFSDADCRDPVAIRKENAVKLGIYDARDLNITTPFDRLPQHLVYQSVFILKVGEKTYLINTEGFTYCRYVVQCKLYD